MIKVLIDTNVLVYAYDRSEPQKQQQALRVLDKVVRASNGSVSMQVLVEFCFVALRKLTQALTAEQVEERLNRYAQIFTVFPVTQPVVQTGLRGTREHGLSFWDAQIWAVALLHHIPVILSEDFTPGTVIEGVHFENPFAGL